jgi:hypothetical protein
MASVVTAPPKPGVQRDCAARIANQKRWEFSHFFCRLSHFREFFSHLFFDLRIVRNAYAAAVFCISTVRPRQFARFSHYISHFRASEFGDRFELHCVASQSGQRLPS